MIYMFHCIIICFIFLHIYICWYTHILKQKNEREKETILYVHPTLYSFCTQIKWISMRFRYYVHTQERIRAGDMSSNPWMNPKRWALLEWQKVTVGFVFPAVVINASIRFNRPWWCKMCFFLRLFTTYHQFDISKWFNDLTWLLLVLPALYVSTCWVKMDPACHVCLEDLSNFCRGFFSSNPTRVSVEHVDCEAVEGLAAAWMMTARDSDSLQVPHSIFRNALLVKLDT